MIKGFSFIANAESRALILGSMPSVASLEKGQYYAHPRNRFWRVMAAALGQPLPDDYADRVGMLISGGVALWDVVDSCERRGSADSDIKNARINDIPRLLADFPNIKKVATNGRKAAMLLAATFPRIKFVCLPSTSPANAAFDLDRLIERYTGFLNET